VYPNDGVLVPPDMNTISVQWTPYGAPFKEFEVDFNNSVTNVRITAVCGQQTVDTEQPPQPSGGCELVLDQNMWQALANANRGGDAVVVTVRGTTDGTCASTSSNTVNVNFAQEDLLGAIYYWKSTVTSIGTGGEIWVKSFGDQTPEQDITTPLNLGTCNGCHALSRDGLRMVINSDDSDSDDEYSDVRSSLIDMMAKQIVGNTGGGRVPGAMGPGFASFYPDHSEFLLSNGLGSAMPPTNMMFLYDGNTDAPLPSLMNVGAATDMATMPDWSPDGKTVLFVIPQKSATWAGRAGRMPHNDDDHIFGGSLYTMPYNGNMQFGAPTPLLMSGGENNYYPGYSPDGQLIVFDRVPLSGTIDACVMSPQPACANDSFSNPAARLTLMKSMPGATPVDLERANGSPAASPQPLSNSWPKWSPFLNNYKGDKLLWIAFSSTRDYGIRVRNHQAGMYQCYPPDSLETPGAQHGSQFDPKCQQPQLWMAAIDVTQAITPHGGHRDRDRGTVTPNAVVDPSMAAFWLPFQDITTHNHTPQWTQAVAPPPMVDAGTMCVPQGGDCHAGGTCCAPNVCTAAGTCQPLPQ
jgi:hypothetical protein